MGNICIPVVDRKKHTSELQPVNESQHEGAIFSVHRWEKTPGSKYSSTSGLSPRGCMKRDASQGSVHDAGCLGLVHWDDPEGWYGKGGGRGLWGLH